MGNPCLSIMVDLPCNRKMLQSLVRSRPLHLLFQYSRIHNYHDFQSIKLLYEVGVVQ